jgi:hypothetical protein
MPEDHVFEDREGALDRASSKPHGLRCGTEIHSLQGVVIDVPLHQAARRARTFRFHSTSGTGVGLSSIDHAVLAVKNLFAM